MIGKVRHRAGWSFADLGRVRTFVIAILAVCGIAARLPVASVAAEPVDMLLVLAADVSRSVDEAKFQLQRQGYSAAITDPTVLRTIALGRYGKIAVCFVEWSGSSSQRLLIDWAVISSAADAQSIAQQLRDLPRSFSDRTSISGGIDFAVSQFERSPFTSDRHVIDVSGDGTNNSGRDVTAARDEALTKGTTTINGLVIFSEVPSAYNPEHTHPPGGLDNYYRHNVVGGADSFVVAAENFGSFGKAILAKLIREVSQAKSPSKPS
jgi:Protein of unknown function (DUF1194)